MSFSINSNVVNAVEPPIAEAQSWISGRTFPKNKPLLKDGFFSVERGEVVGLFGASGSGKCVFSLFLMAQKELYFFQIYFDLKFQY